MIIRSDDTPIWCARLPASGRTNVITPNEHGRSLKRHGELARLREDVFAARSACQLARRGPQRHPQDGTTAAAHLLDCLEAYAAALLTRGLPLPRAIHDELRLQRLLADRDHTG